MTNGIAIALGGLIVGVIVANGVMGWGLGVFLGRLLADAINWLAFWR